MKKHTYEFVKNKFEEVGYILLEINYVNAYTPMRYKCPNHPDKELKITYDNLKLGKRCRYCAICKKSHEQFMIEFNKHDSSKYIDILGEYRDSNKLIKVQCKKDGFIWDTIASTLIGKRKAKSCLVCMGKMVVSGINDISTTHENITKWMKDKDISKLYSQGSSYKVVFVCPDCEFEFTRKIAHACERGLSCPHCGDGISFPEKFMIL